MMNKLSTFRDQLYSTQAEVPGVAREIKKKDTHGFPEKCQSICPSRLASYS